MAARDMRQMAYDECNGNDQAWGTKANQPAFFRRLIFTFA